jgi:phosphoenolpyruvate carboxylase
VAFDTVEQVRHTSKGRRRGDEEAAQVLAEIVDTLGLGARRILIKAFSNFFQLINIAEDQQRIRVLRQRERDGRLAESIDFAIRTLCESGMSADQMRALLNRIRVRLVMTAHPTEAKRKEVLVKMREIACLMAMRDRQELLPREQRDLDAALAEAIEELWQTRPTRAARATVADEVDYGIYFITTEVMDAVVDIYAALREALIECYPDEDWTHLPPMIGYASWIGGDRDGNPNVTPEVTQATMRTLRRAAQQVYLNEIASLRDRLTQSVDEVRISVKLQTSITDGDEIQYPSELYRQKFDAIWQRLQADGYKTGVDLLDDLRLVEASLRENRGQRVADGSLRRLIEKVRLFGLHLLPLDIREDARLQADAIDELFRTYGVAENYLELAEGEKQQLLIREIKNARPLFPVEPQFSDNTNRIIETWRMIAQLQRQYGPQE